VRSAGDGASSRVFEFRSSQDISQPDATASYDENGFIVDCRDKTRFPSLAQWAKAIKGRSVSVKPYIYYLNKSLRQHEEVFSGAGVSTPQGSQDSASLPGGGGRKSLRGKKESRGLGVVSEGGGEGEEKGGQAAAPRSSRPQRSCAQMKKPVEADSEEDDEVPEVRQDDGEWKGSGEEEEEDDDDEDGDDDDEWNLSGDDDAGVKGKGEAGRGRAGGKASPKRGGEKRTPLSVVGKYFAGGAPPSGQGRSRGGRATARARAAVRPRKKKGDKGRARADAGYASSSSGDGGEVGQSDDGDVGGSRSRAKQWVMEEEEEAKEVVTSTGRSKRETGTAAARKDRSDPQLLSPPPRAGCV